MKVNLNLMKQNVTQVNGGTTTDDVSVKKLTYVKKHMFGILVHLFVTMENIQQVLWMI